MRDLRRRVLESNKTVSRKARSQVASAASSAAPSPETSRAASRSRQPSDDDDDDSDGTAWSTNSIDELLFNDEDGGGAYADQWKAELSTRIEQMTNLKRSSTEGRTESLNAYATILMARYASEEIEPHIGQLMPSILRSIRQVTTEREALKALKALVVTIVTLDSPEIYDDVVDQLKRSMKSGSVDIQVSAIHALGIAAFFGGASPDEMLELMNTFLEIVESDGASVDAEDDASVVTAALENWALLATEVDDLEEETEAAAEAFVEQLESADAGVQIAAGENIALLYEKSYTLREDDEDLPSEELDRNHPEAIPDAEKYVKRYQVYRREDQLLRTLEELAHVSTRRISKKDRKTLHSSFADIRNSVERPSRGPGYSTAIDQESGKAYGSGRMKVKINRQVELRIDKWWKLQRLNALRRVLQGGFTHHYDHNGLVSAAL